MHIRKVHSAYKCAPGLSERRRLGAAAPAAARKESITSIETFFAVALPTLAFIYLYTRCFVFICRRLSSRRNAPEDYKAREIFSGHDRHNSSAPLVLLSFSRRRFSPARGRGEPSHTGEESFAKRRREKEKRGQRSRNTSAYLSRAARGC